MIDLYNVPDPQKYLKPLEARIEDADVSEPMEEYYNNGKNNLLNFDN